MLRHISLAALVALPLLLEGCGSSNSGSGSGSVRLVNATTDYPSLDLTSSTGNGVSTGATPVLPGSYGGVDAGTQVLNLKATGTGGSVATGSYAIGKDARYSVVAYVSSTGLTGTLLNESDTAAPTSGTAKFRIFNTVYNRTVPNDTDKLDTYVTTAGCADLPSTVSPVSSGTTALSTFTEIAATTVGTTYRVCITGANDRSDLRLDLPTVTLKDQQITTLVLTSSPGGVLVNGVQIDQGGTVTPRPNASARVRLVADAAAGGSVSATVGGVTLASATGPLPSPRVGGYALVPVGSAGTLAASVRVNNGTAVTSNVTAAPGTDLTLLVTGTATAPQVTPIADNNRASTVVASPVKVRVVNGINGLPVGSGVDLIVNHAQAASNVVFPTASPSVAVAATTAAAPSSLEVTSTTPVVPNGTTVPTTLVYRASGTDAVLVAGKTYTVFVLGDVNNVTSVLRQDH